MILKEYWQIGGDVFIENLDGSKRNGTITSLPFPD
jgi:dimethylsulfoniopropionate demethylase